MTENPTPAQQSPVPKARPKKYNEPLTWQDLVQMAQARPKSADGSRRILLEILNEIRREFAVDTMGQGYDELLELLRSGAPFEQVARSCGFQYGPDVVAYLLRVCPAQGITWLIGDLLRLDARFLSKRDRSFEATR